MSKSIQEGHVIMTDPTREQQATILETLAEWRRSGWRGVSILKAEEVSAMEAGAKALRQSSRPSLSPELEAAINLTHLLKELAVEQRQNDDQSRSAQPQLRAGVCL